VETESAVRGGFSYFFGGNCSCKYGIIIHLFCSKNTARSATLILFIGHSGVVWKKTIKLGQRIEFVKEVFRKKTTKPLDHVESSKRIFPRIFPSKWLIVPKIVESPDPFVFLAHYPSLLSEYFHLHHSWQLVLSAKPCLLESQFLFFDFSVILECWSFACNHLQ